MKNEYYGGSNEDLHKTQMNFWKQEEVCIVTYNLPTFLKWLAPREKGIFNEQNVSLCLGESIELDLGSGYNKECNHFITHNSQKLTFNYMHQSVIRFTYQYLLHRFENITTVGFYVKS